MTPEEKEALRAAIAPIAIEIQKNFVEAMCLRVEVHIELALSNGAEDEDIPCIIANAIESAVDITTDWFSKLGEMEKCHDFTKRKDI